MGRHAGTCWKRNPAYEGLELTPAFRDGHDGTGLVSTRRPCVDFVDISTRDPCPMTRSHIGQLSAAVQPSPAVYQATIKYVKLGHLRQAPQMHLPGTTFGIFTS